MSVDEGRSRGRKSDKEVNRSAEESDRRREDGKEEKRVRGGGNEREMLR